MLRSPRRSWIVLGAFAVLLSACDRSPTSSAAGTYSADEIAAIATAIDGMVAPDAGPSAMAAGGSLDALLHQAVEKVTHDQGRDAAMKLLAPLNKLLLDAEKAARSGDTATVRTKLSAARTEEIRIIVSVLGADPISAYVAGVANRAKEWHARLDSLAAAGKDVTKARAALATIDADVAAAASALKTDPGKALDLAAQATDLLNGLVRDVSRLATPPAPPPLPPAPPPLPAWSLTGDFAAALAKISHDQGEAAAKTILEQVAKLQLAADAALLARDTATANAKLGAIRALEIQTIVAALGKPAVEAAVEAVDSALADVRAKIRADRGAGKNVSSAAQAADKAAALLKEAQDALGKGQFASAFDDASQAGEWVTKALGSLPRA